MPNNPISMSKLRQLIKLHCQGQSKLRISAVTGMSRNTVKKYISQFICLQITFEEACLLSDSALNAMFNKEPEIVLPEKLKALYKFFPEVERRLKQRGMTQQKLWEEYISGNPDGYRRAHFNHLFTIWKKKAEPSMHMDHKAGDKLFIDFAGERLKILDKETGELKPVDVFVSLLGASQYTYIEAVENQSTEELILACENALHFFGGAPAAIVPDNLKAAVIKSSRYEPQINENFALFAEHYGMTVLPARAYKPKDKALVEGAVKIAYNRIYTNLPKEHFCSLEELNITIRELLLKHNSSSFKGRSYSRKEQFDEMEKQALQALPESRFEQRKQLQLTVMQNGHVFLQPDKHYYSVPHSYMGKKVRIFYSKSLVEVYYKYDLIASHKRIKSPFNYTTEPSHLSSQHQYVSGWTPEFFLNQAREVHPDVEYYISQVLMKKPHPEQAYKSCQGILSFGKRVGHVRLTNACRRAHSYGLYHYQIIENILQRRLDEYDESESIQLSMPHHENIRGGNYYQ